MMIRANISATLLVSTSVLLLYMGVVNPVLAAQEQQAEQVTIPGRITGKVTEVIDASGYTYAEVDTGETRVWAAGPHTALEIGDVVSFSSDMPMNNFHSKAMNRDFSVIYFNDRFITDRQSTEATVAATASPHDQARQAPVAEPIKGIKKVADGNSIAEIHVGRDELSGKTVKVRGQVTKFNAQIMGKNWLHIMDSSTQDDLTVTTGDIVAVGDVVIVEGKLELNKDYGYGYSFPLIVEDAVLTQE